MSTKLMNEKIEMILAGQITVQNMGEHKLQKWQLDVIDDGVVWDDARIAEVNGGEQISSRLQMTTTELAMLKYLISRLSIRTLEPFVSYGRGTLQLISNGTYGADIPPYTCTLKQYKQAWYKRRFGRSKKGSAVSALLDQGELDL